jgi:hypothetical protein
MFHAFSAAIVIASVYRTHEQSTPGAPFLMTTNADELVRGRGMQGTICVGECPAGQEKDDACCCCKLDTASIIMISLSCGLCFLGIVVKCCLMMFAVGGIPGEVRRYSRRLSALGGSPGDVRYTTITIPVDGGVQFEWTVDGVVRYFTAPPSKKKGESHEFAFTVNGRFNIPSTGPNLPQAEPQAKAGQDTTVTTSTDLESCS